MFIYIFEGVWAKEYSYYPAQQLRWHRMYQPLRHCIDWLPVLYYRYFSQRPQAQESCVHRPQLCYIVKTENLAEVSGVYFFSMLHCIAWSQQFEIDTVKSLSSAIPDPGLGKFWYAIALWSGTCDRIFVHHTAHCTLSKLIISSSHCT